MKGGGVRAFSVFFEENYSLVVGVAERRLGSRCDAEDVAAQAFVIAWKHYRAGDPLSVPWLYGVVRNLVGTEYRRRDRRDALHSKIGEDLVVSPPPCHDLYSDLRDAVERLPATHREVLKMTYWEGLTATEAAAVLGITPIAMRTRMMRARRLLRHELAEPAARKTLTRLEVPVAE